MRKEKKRLDLLLTERGLFPSREKSRAAIMAGEVLVDEQKIEKAGTFVSADCTVRLLGIRPPFVSRGGLKLAKAIDSFQLDCKGKTIIDIGSSTGGFVDCALQNGAAKIYAVDVGYNQLAWKLRNDPRVVVMEKTNARYLDKGLINDTADMLTADVSFISLALVIPAAAEHLLKDQGEVVALIKPQFEAGREAVSKGGIVRDKSTHRSVIEKIVTIFAGLDLQVQALDYSPITGADGNIEYLIYAIKNAPAQDIDIERVIDCAHAQHKK